MKKLCNNCGEIKSISSFSKHKNSKDGLQWECKSCINKRNREYRDRRKSLGICVVCGKNKTRGGRVTCQACFERHKVIDKEYKTRKATLGECLQCGNKTSTGHTLCSICLVKLREKSRVRISEFSARVGNYFGNECQICHIESTDNEIFDCHHVDSSIKDSDISKMVSRPWDTEVVPELEKCNYLCRNCHARLHAGRLDKEIEAGNLCFVPGKRHREAA